MRVRVVTTIVTDIDLDTQTVEHKVDIAPDAGIPEDMAKATVIGAAKSLIAQLEG